MDLLIVIVGGGYPIVFRAKYLGAIEKAEQLCIRKIKKLYPDIGQSEF